jgi:hypothetical protein
MATPAAPSAGSRTIDFGRSFTFVTEDPEWIKKVLIGGAFTLACALLVGIPFVLGYFARTLRAVASGTRPALPEWDDLGGIFDEGVRLAGVYLLLTLGIVGGLILVFFVLLSPVLLSGGGRQSDAMGAFASLVIAVGYLAIMVVSLALAAYLPAGLARAALERRASALLEWRANFELIRANLANYALSLVSYLLASFLAQFGVLLCCVGVFPAAFYGYLVLAGSLGETVRLSSQRG